MLVNQAQAEYDETDLTIQLEEETYGDYTSNEEPVLIDNNGNKYYIINTLELFHPEAYAEDLETGWGYYLERKGDRNKIIVKDYPSFNVIYNSGDYDPEWKSSKPESLISNARKALNSSLGINNN